MDSTIRRDLRFLKGYAIVSTAVFVALGFSAFQRAPQPTKFTEIDVERINFVEPDGKLRLVISNRARSIGPVYKGKPFGYPGGTRPGMIFFNDEGTENGGLTFTGRRGPDGRYQAGTNMSFDQFDQDQVVVLSYQDNNGQRRSGLTISDRADVNIYDMVLARDSIMKITDTTRRAAAMREWQAPRNGVPLYAERAYVGRDRSKNAVVNLSDAQGRPRLRMIVDSLGAARIEFLDERGQVTTRLPQ
jgi:hypothetical protein